MKPLRTLTLAAMMTASLHAQQQEGPNLQELMQKLFDAQATQEQVLERAKEAGKAGIPRQQIIEAKLVWGLRNQDAEWFAKIQPELEVLVANFDREQSAGFKSADEIRAFIYFGQALQAQAANDEAGFKNKILEAIWLNPGQAQVFLQTIDKGRMQAKLAQMKVDLDQVITTHDGEATTLKDVLGDKKALLLDFWASWCGPCMRLMPELKKKAKLLTSYDIVVAGMNKDDQNAQSLTAKVHEEQGIEFPWLIEPAERPFTKTLEIESIPRMILIAPSGQVLFNGHPEDPALWVALKKVNPEIQVPAGK